MSFRERAKGGGNGVLPAVAGQLYLGYQPSHPALKHHNAHGACGPLPTSDSGLRTRSTDRIFPASYLPNFEWFGWAAPEIAPVPSPPRRVIGARAANRIVCLLERRRHLAKTGKPQQPTARLISSSLCVPPSPSSPGHREREACVILNGDPHPFHPAARLSGRSRDVGEILDPRSPSSAVPMGSGRQLHHVVS